MMHRTQTCSNTGATAAAAPKANAPDTSLHDITTLSIAELMDRWPAAVPVFVAHRMACVGCVMSPFDRLDDVCRIYRMQTPEFADEIRRAIEIEEQP
jgi:hybrid cluster-associated redox disulfide protein